MSKEEILKEEFEQALKRGGVEYATGYTEGLSDMFDKNKALTDEIEELKRDLFNIQIESSHEIADLVKENQQLQSRISELEKVNEKHIESLNYVRNNPKTWKSGGIGGQDQYAGMPPMLRYVDEIIDNLTTLKQTNKR